MPTNGFSIKPLKVKLLAGEQKKSNRVITGIFRFRDRYYRSGHHSSVYSAPADFALRGLLQPLRGAVACRLELLDAKGCCDLADLKSMAKIGDSSDTILTKSW